MCCKNSPTALRAQRVTNGGAMGDMTVRQIKPQEVRPWLLLKHYARRLCPISYAFGLYDDDILVGVVTYGMPASPSLCVGVCVERSTNATS